MRESDELFAALAKSAFRRKFHLQGKDLVYLHNKDLTTVLSHANDFISQRLAPAFPEKDGKQLAFREHPVFVAQHATACCCRGCLEKWHHVAFHDSHLWALSPGGQRAHALVGGGTGTGHPYSRFWVRIAGEPGAYVAQSGRRASHIAQATLKAKPELIVN